MVIHICIDYGFSPNKWVNEARKLLLYNNLENIHYRPKSCRKSLRLFGLVLYLFASNEFLGFCSQLSPDPHSPSTGYQASSTENRAIDYERLADAVYKAEGGAKAFVPYGVMFKGCDKDHPAYCRRICINTLRNTHKRWISSNSSIPYLQFLRNRYAPLSHHSLNQHWLKNVRFFYEK